MPHPAHEPTPELEKIVQQAAGFGMPHEMIATLIGISEKTLFKHYRDDPVRGNLLAKGKAHAVFQVAGTLFHRATVGKDLGAAIFFLKSQAGYREKHVLDEQAGKGTLADLVLASLGLTPPANDPAALEHATPEDRARVVQ